MLHIILLLFIIIILNLHPRIFFIIDLERKEGGEGGRRERGRLPSVASCAHPNKGSNPQPRVRVAPDQDANPLPFGVWDGIST